MYRLFVTLGLALLVGTASAQVPPEADRLHGEAKELFKEQRYAEAAQRFESAYQSRPFGAFLINAGLSWLKAERPIEAFDTFERFLRVERAGEARFSREADRKAMVAKANGELTRLEAELKKTYGRLSILSEDADAIITLRRPGGDGIGPLTPPTRRWLEPGVWVVSGSTPDNRGVAVSTRVIKGAERSVALVFRAVDGGVLTVKSSPDGAEVTVGEKRRGTTPITLRDLAPGVYVVRLTHGGFQPYETSVTVADGRPQSLSFELVAEVTTKSPARAEAPVYETWWFWTIIGAVVVGGVTAGLVVGLQAEEAVVAPFSNRWQLP